MCEFVAQKLGGRQKSWRRFTSGERRGHSFFPEGSDQSKWLCYIITEQQDSFSHWHGTKSSRLYFSLFLRVVETVSSHTVVNHLGICAKENWYNYNLSPISRITLYARKRFRLHMWLVVCRLSFVLGTCFELVPCLVGDVQFQSSFNTDILRHSYLCYLYTMVY